MPKPILLLLLWAMLLVRPAFGQSAQGRHCVDVSRVNLAQNVLEQSEITYIEKDKVINQQLVDTIGFRKLGKRFVSNTGVGKQAILRFRLTNRGDSAVKLWFYPGLNFWRIDLYRSVEGQLKSLPEELPDIADREGYRGLSIAAHDSGYYYVRLVMAKTYLNMIFPRLIHPQYLFSFTTQLHNTHRQIDMVSYLFCGLLLMMILYSLSVFLLDGNLEFMYYSGYAFFVGIMLFTKTYFNFSASSFGFFLEEYLDFILQCIGHGFYMLFMQKYLDTRRNHPFLHRLYNFGMAFIILSMLVYTGLHYFSNNFVLENAVENICKFGLLGFVIVFLVYSLLKWENKLFRFLFWGNFCLLLCAVFSMLLTLIPKLNDYLPGLLRSGVFYYELGLFFELLFFLLALNYKNRKQIMMEVREKERLKADNQMKEYEKEIAVYKAQQDERQRISADMHDELGSGMTAIRLMSEIARNKMKDQTPVEIEKISQSADEVLNKMNAIIWSMNSGNDTLDNLLYYIRAYALEYFENTEVECKVNLPDQIDFIDINGDKRRNVFLCVKETLNNALKHAQASEIIINVTIDDQLVILISDNGKGIDLQKLRQFGNGLKNIQRRMESIGGTYEIGNNKGTFTRLSLPLSQVDEE